MENTTIPAIDFASIQAIVSDQPLNTALAIGGATALGALFLVFYSKEKDEEVYQLGGFSVTTAWKFFSKRFDFLQNSFKSTGRNLFQFRVLQHRVIATSGAEARKVFFTDPSLDLVEGYRILMGGAPNVRDMKVESSSNLTIFLKRLLILTRQDRVQAVLPSLIDDMAANMDTWGTEGQINPFNQLYDIIFQMTVRMATCRELANDPEAMETLKKHYWNLEKSATPATLLLPWLPTSSKKLNETSTRELFMMLYGYVEKRRAASVPSNDAIDLFIKEGDDTQRIVENIMGIIFAGVINTGMNVCWLLLFLGVNPEWTAKVKAEVLSLIANHTDTLSPEPLFKRIHAIPMSAWENDLPAIEACIRETLRLIMNGTTIRRNVHKNITLEGKKIEKSDFLTYSLSDIHLNSSIYEDPETFDPTRYAPGREEDKKVQFGYMAWGGGRHPCAGMRLAKLEMKIALVMLLGGYDHEIVDKHGRPPKTLPQPDRNDIQMARPLGDPCFLKFKRRS